MSSERSMMSSAVVGVLQYLGWTLAFLFAIAAWFVESAQLSAFRYAGF